MRDYFCIPLSSTAAERSFSSAGLIATIKRASLKCGTIENQVLVGNWMKWSGTGHNAVRGIMASDVI